MICQQVRGCCRDAHVPEERGLELWRNNERGGGVETTGSGKEMKSEMGAAETVEVRLYAAYSFGYVPAGNLI